jgi:hypothetical protein
MLLSVAHRADGISVRLLSGRAALRTPRQSVHYLAQQYNLTDNQVAQLRADPESWIREHLPDFIDEPALATSHAAGDG